MGSNDVARIVFTAHAHRRMKERGVSGEEVLEALKNPVQHHYDRHRDVYLALGENGIAVVYAYHGSLVEIVTVLRRSEYEALVRRIGRRRYKLI
ncbi:MAG: DUF4258 domain-containing protein [Pyrodictiaceae archaeon]